MRAFPRETASDQAAGGSNGNLTVCVATYNVLSLLDGVPDAQMGLDGAVGRPTLLQGSMAAANVHTVWPLPLRRVVSLRVVMSTPASVLSCGYVTTHRVRPPGSWCFTPTARGRSFR